MIEMEPIEIESSRTVTEEFWTLDDSVQKELLNKAIRGSRGYGREPNKEWYHGIVTVGGHDDLLDVTYHNPSRAILWKVVGQLDNKSDTRQKPRKLTGASSQQI